MSRILADANVPEEYVSALRGDGHDIVYSREISGLGPEATDDAIVAYAESEGMSIVMTERESTETTRRQIRRKI